MEQVLVELSVYTGDGFVLMCSDATDVCLERVLVDLLT